MSCNCPQTGKEHLPCTTHPKCWGSTSDQQGPCPSQGALPPPATLGPYPGPLERAAHIGAQYFSHQGLDCCVETTAAVLVSCPAQS